MKKCACACVHMHIPLSLWLIRLFQHPSSSFSKLPSELMDFRSELHCVPLARAVSFWPISKKELIYVSCIFLGLTAKNGKPHWGMLIAPAMEREIHRLWQANKQRHKIAACSNLVFKKNYVTSEWRGIKEEAVDAWKKLSLSSVPLHCLSASK